jgi:aspartyl-tRNA(Asn)/glutamyl-tRNA(Gln) amidotransferase subunit A
MTLAETAAAIATGRLDPLSHAQAHLARIAQANPALHAMAAPDPTVPAQAETLRARLARGETLPLAGIPIAVKDAFDSAGLPTTANARLRQNAPPAAHDAPAVARLRQAGAIILGKATCWEMSVGGPSDASPQPPAINPWAPHADPGGSSNGSAVAVASGMAMAALGGDTGGSIRLPAAFCGLAGFKPTHGKVPLQGAIPFAESLDVIGPLAPTAADCALLHAVLANEAPHPPIPLHGLRLAIPQALLAHAPPTPAMAQALAAAIATLRHHGASITEAPLPSAALFNPCYFLIARSEAFALWRHALATAPETLNPLTRRSFAIGAQIPPEALANAHRLRTALRAELAAAFAEADALLLPTTPDEAADLDFTTAFSRPDTAPYTRPFSLAGVPAISLPCALGPRGRPLGLQLVGRHGEDSRLLAIATAIEQALPPIGAPKEWWT